MHTRARIVAGTALALVMAGWSATSAQAGSLPAPGNFSMPAPTAATQGVGSPVLLAQATEEEEPREETPAQQAPVEEPPAEQPQAEQPQAEQPQAEQPQAEQPQAEQEVQEEPAPQQPVVEEPSAEEPQEAAPAEPEAPAAQEPTAREPAAQEPEQPPAEAAPEAPAEAAPEEPADAPAEPAEGEVDRGTEPVPGEPAQPQDPAPTPPRQDATPPAAEGTPPQPGERPADSGAEPVPTPPPSDARPPVEGAAPPAEDATPPAQEGGQAPADSGVEPVTDDSREAPVLDSAKEDPAAGETPPAGGEQQQQEPAEAAAPPPTSDKEAQRFEEPVEVQSLRAEEGSRIDRRELRRERREGADVLREIGDRVVIQLNNQVIVRSDDRDRLEHGASDVYYEELPRGRTRETVVRDNGVQVVTVYDRYGDVIRRARILPDGREHVLVYAGGRDRDERREWRDPGAELPPLRLYIPRDEYILDAGRVRDEGSYYDFLAQPPVEQVRRTYSVDEVRYSARVRDSVRRVDLDTITFDFGSATISEAAIPRLEGVADAMEQLLENNPGEVFLIEGHTDAVGSDQANLALSDRRAEAVARAMSDVFAIPPENLVTQGYGERYLKINTGEPEQENRRVAIRRITPLVAPVASAR